MLDSARDLDKPIAERRFDVDRLKNTRPSDADEHRFPRNSPAFPRIADSHGLHRRGRSSTQFAIALATPEMRQGYVSATVHYVAAAAVSLPRVDVPRIDAQLRLAVRA